MSDLLGTVPVLLYGVCALACPLGMGAMMWFMMRGGSKAQAANGQTSPSTSGDAREDIARLQAEVDELREAQGAHDGQRTA